MINKLIHISKYAGMREDLVQAGGGNSSVKIDDKVMLIKSSGYQLTEVTANSGYTVVNYQKIIHSLCANNDDLQDNDGKEILANAIIDGNKPSIETFLHGITGKYTLHTHPIVVNILMARKDGKELAKKIFPDSIIVDYATPGIKLAKKYYKAIYKAHSSSCQIIFLRNHGLVISCDSETKVIDLTEHVVLQIEKCLNLTEKMLPYHKATEIWNFIPEKTIWRITDSNILSSYQSFGLRRYNFCPDCIVFLGKKPWSPKGLTKKSLQKFRQYNGDPVIIEYCGNIYICAENVKKAMEIQSVMSFSSQVAENIEPNNCKFLSEKEQNFLLNWDAEKYRQQFK